MVPDADIVVGKEVPHREPVDLDTVHEAAQGVDERPPGTAGRHRVAGAVARGRMTPEPLAKGLVRVPSLLADGLRCPQTAQLPAPGGVAPVDLHALGVGQRGERIALGGMQPAAAEVERKPGSLDRVGSSSEPRQRLHEQDGQPRRGEAPGCGDPRRARAHDDDVKEPHHRRALPVATAPGEDARNGAPHQPCSGGGRLVTGREALVRRGRGDGDEPHIAIAEALDGGASHGSRR